MKGVANLRRGAAGRIMAALFLCLAFGTGVSASHGSGLLGQQVSNVYAKSSGCRLNSPTGAIHHVIYIQFDNVHFTRDNPNVPSDLEQMPHLLNFITNNGTLLTNHHTPLIAHTADDILTSITGVYPDRHGQPVANSFDYFQKNGVPQYTSSFKYWTDPVDPTNDPSYNMIDQAGKNTPAPWVTYTRAGCNVGAFGTANIELENVSSDVNTVFGPNSPEAVEAKANHDKAVADFEGVSVHCAAGNTVCSKKNGGVVDMLPQEPGGYHGYNALFGAKFVDARVYPGGIPRDLNGKVIADCKGNPGFPGFDPTAAQTLGYVANMQEHGVPVTYSYIADAHDVNSCTTSGSYGPGQAGYVAQLKSYDTAFGKFFANLQAHGINKSNTLFVITADEGDHFVGGEPTNPGCNGVTVPCNYSKIGEIDGDMPALLKHEFGITTPFDNSFDSSPSFYLNNRPAQTSQTITRPFERAVGQLTAPNPVTGRTTHVANYLADQTELRLLHMVTADPLRTPTFTMFGNPDYYWQTYSNCPKQPDYAVCEEGPTGDSYNHGTIAPQVNRTFLGLVGPGIQNLGIDPSVWTDHVDIRPTILALVGLQDDYVSDGRVITQVLTNRALTSAERGNLETLNQLGDYYKQINAPVGELAMSSLKASTIALQSGSASNDSAYAHIESQIAALTGARNKLALSLSAVLNGAEFRGRVVSQAQAHGLEIRSEDLLAWARYLAAQNS